MTDRVPGYLVWLVSAWLVASVIHRPEAHLMLVGSAMVVARGGTSNRLNRLIVLGIALGAVRVVMYSLTSHSGSQVLGEVTAIHVPLGFTTLQLGGRIYAEAVVSGLTESLRLVAILASIGAFLAKTEISDLLRMVPRRFFDLALVINIAASFIPSLQTTYRCIYEAQRSRGASKVRSSLLGLTPLLTTAMERSIHLAESMDSRGFGSASRTKLRPRDTDRVFLLASCLPLVVAVGLVSTAGILPYDPYVSGWTIQLPALIVGLGFVAPAFADLPEALSTTRIAAP